MDNQKYIVYYPRDKIYVIWILKKKDALFEWNYTGHLKWATSLCKEDIELRMGLIGPMGWEVMTENEAVIREIMNE